MGAGLDLAYGNMGGGMVWSTLGLNTTVISKDHEEGGGVLKMHMAQSSSELVDTT